MDDGIVYLMLIFCAFIVPLAVVGAMVEGYTALHHWLAHRREAKRRNMRYRPMATLNKKEK